MGSQSRDLSAVQWKGWIFGLAIASLALGSPGARAGEPAVAFPTDWVGSPPLSAEALRGKAVLFYFYEEQCPGCKAKWPQILEAARTYQDQPILFVAVNSGTTRADVEQYVREVGLDWPVIVDTDRSFEAACGIAEVNLQNIHQVAFLNAQGQVLPGSFSDLPGTATKALAGAKWTVDPSEIPDELKPAWRSLEFGEYAAVGAELVKAKTSRKADVKAAAKKLLETVDSQIQTELTAAAAEPTPYRAAEHYAAVATRFAGYPAAEKATTLRRELTKKPAYKKELAAIKLFEKQRQLAASDKPAVRERALAALRKLAADAPDSEAGRRAAELIEGN
jgi:thiol-disulfide isomerase/thioredoxin